MRLPIDPPPHCQFPLWDDERPSHAYCGAPAVPGSSYCPRHHARCWTPAPRLPLPAEPEPWLAVISGGMA